ncbi:MAG: hypothetical protein KME45_11950 [Stenomitos rutilans HA7619-LM2]|nr:hypothetical protein [Stenomitos rutilans HA7619-LM2]
MIVFKAAGEMRSPLPTLADCLDQGRAIGHILRGVLPAGYSSSGSQSSANASSIA